MVRLTCMLRRKHGMTTEAFYDHWFNVHGPLIRASESGRYVLRYEQHPRTGAPEVDDGGFDGVTMQWFASMADYEASLMASDFGAIWTDIESFLDTTKLHFILTEEPTVVIAKEGN